MSRRKRSEIAAYLNDGHSRAEAVEHFTLPLATIKEVEMDATRGAR